MKLCIDTEFLNGRFVLGHPSIRPAALDLRSISLARPIPQTSSPTHSGDPLPRPPFPICSGERARGPIFRAVERRCAALRADEPRYCSVKTI